MHIDCVHDLLAATARYGGSEAARSVLEMRARDLPNSENEFPKIPLQNDCGARVCTLHIFYRPLTLT